MVRLLFTATFAYVAYRICREMAEPARHPPHDDSETLRQQSAALGVDPAR